MESHDAILAEGAWSETYLNDDNRGIFHNAFEYEVMYPGEEMGIVRYCAPRLRDGAAVEATRMRLVRRISELADCSAMQG